MMDFFNNMVYATCTSKAIVEYCCQCLLRFSNLAQTMFFLREKTFMYPRFPTRLRFLHKYFPLFQREPGDVSLV